MRRKIHFLTFLLAVAVMASACGTEGNDSGGNSTGDNGEYPYGHYEDDKMIGTASSVNTTENIIEVDISEWSKRDWKGPNLTSEGYYYNARFSEETAITYENGAAASIDDIKNGQKVLVNPPADDDNSEAHADEIVLMDMTYEEKYWRLLSHIDGFNIVVMYEYGDPPPPEMQEPLYENSLAILEGTEYDAVGAHIEYDSNYVVDFKEELDIEQFPVIFVFDQKEELFKGYTVDELYAFFENIRDN
ncbi:hypothetical protein DHX103_10825 [Planococcus sp. X10-3]|uniref:hypothetical protein n=1 Tax=Planococcus sp. X10-3 TaxID=3061240 RepID=UPI003BB085ED